MLTKLRIQNFKAWKDTGHLRMAPLTVLFGTNSGGKTSIPQRLLLLKQTEASPDRQRALHLGDSRTAVDVGTFDDVVHNHDMSRPVECCLANRVSPMVRRFVRATRTRRSLDPTRKARPRRVRAKHQRPLVETAHENQRPVTSLLTASDNFTHRAGTRRKRTAT